MNNHPEKLACMGCGAYFPDIDGPVHRYMQSTPGCWAAFGQVLAREYSDMDYYRVHRLSVDAYAVQHPGVPSRQSIQSVGLHLVRLCQFLEYGLSEEQANDAMLAAGKIKSDMIWLEPPIHMGDITVADVVKATSAEAHQQRVQAWAESAWQAWSPHHDTIRRWLPVDSHISQVPG